MKTVKNIRGPKYKFWFCSILTLTFPRQDLDFFQERGHNRSISQASTSISCPFFGMSLVLCKQRIWVQTFKEKYVRFGRPFDIMLDDRFCALFLCNSASYLDSRYSLVVLSHVCPRRTFRCQ